MRGCARDRVSSLEAGRAASRDPGPLGLPALGFFGRWPSLAVFAALYIAVATVHERWSYERPLECDPICGSPAEGIVLVLPFLLILLASGAIARTVLQRRQRISD